jgi:hypothetical protein
LDNQGTFQQIAICDRYDLYAFNHQHIVWTLQDALWIVNNFPEPVGYFSSSIK